MSAEVESMMFVGKTPWHGEGTYIPEGENLSIKKGLEKSGMDWEVKLQNLVTLPQAQSAVNYAHKLDQFCDTPEVKPNVRSQAVVRSTDNKVLGVVGPSYNPLQNKEAFEWFQPFLDAKLCSLHTAGSLCGGSKVWVLAQLNKKPSIVAKNDEVCKFILLSNSHDGSSAVRVGYTPIRVVCSNTLGFAHSNNSSKLLRVRHTSQLHNNLNDIRDIMNTVDAEFEATAEKYAYLATKQINTKDLRKYVKLVLDVDEIPDEKIKTRTKNKINRIIELCETGRGNTNPVIRNTYWSAYSGVNEYLNYELGRNNNRLNNLWFGTGLKLNDKALKTALSLAS